MAIVILLLELFVLVLWAITMYLLARPMVRGAIYFPTSPSNVERIIRFAELKPGQQLIDIGSGDGRILIAAAQQGVIATGYEINPILVWQSRRAIARAGVVGQASVKWQSLWKADLSHYDAVVVYGIPYIMGQLKRKLEREVRPGTKIISNVFSVPGWQPLIKEEGVKVYTMSV
jgi:precorrin-6B methylase 2